MANLVVLKRAITLASKSPRRREILTQMGLPFQVVTREVDESFPADLRSEAAARYIAEKKAKAFLDGTIKYDLLLSADTIVCLEGEIIGKPVSAANAMETLSRLSGRSHEVISAIAFLDKGICSSFAECTRVRFRRLSEAEISYYVTAYEPFDKAGSYGIQEWIGQIGIESIEGSYTNVMGLPSSLLYSRLKEMGALEIG